MSPLERRLILVRHAQPAIDPSMPASRWRLTEEGRTGAASLGQRLALYRPRACYSSPEPKAIETAAGIVTAIDVPVVPVPGLAEHAREDVPFLGSAAAFRERLLEVFARPGEVVFGEESAHQAAERFTDAMDLVMEEAGAESVVAVSHGTVMSLYVSGRIGLNAVEFWDSLGWGAFVVIGWESGQVLDFDAGDRGGP
ncbi:MAG: histidine phosphatase family protein [Gemmatimonadota bacterium]|nr:histidine phosphatase family protein [Gemmatimonadota bacterium]